MNKDPDDNFMSGAAMSENNIRGQELNLSRRSPGVYMSAVEVF